MWYRPVSFFFASLKPSSRFYANSRYVFTLSIFFKKLAIAVFFFTLTHLLSLMTLNALGSGLSFDYFNGEVLFIKSNSRPMRLFLALIAVNLFGTLYGLAHNIYLDIASLVEGLKLTGGNLFSSDLLDLAKINPLGANSKTSLLSSLESDVDLFSSTDFEDLLVFSLDALELLWQDVNLVIELCGENLMVAGIFGISVFSTKVFSSRRLKK